MADPAQIDITADRRVDHFETWSFLDVDYTGSTFKMQIRAVKDSTGTPLLEVTTGTGNFSILYAGTATVSAHITAGRLTSEIKELVNPATGDKYVDGDSVLLSQIQLGISDFEIVALPEPAAMIPAGELGDDWQGWFDIIRTPAVGSAEIIIRGKFTVRAGVTIP